MDEKSGSSWDELIEQLGAKPAPDALERRRPTIENQFEPSAEAPPPPPVAKGNWNALAQDLGVEAPDEPEPPRPSRAFTRREPPIGPDAVEASFAAIEPLESVFEEIIEEEIADVEFAEGDDDSDDDIFFEEEDAEAPDDEGDDLPPSALSGEAARSAFEALFQIGGPGAPPRRPAPPRSRPESRRDERQGTGRGPRRESPPRPPRDDAPEEPDRRGDEESGGAEEGDRRPRRRRRRGGRGRSSAAREARPPQTDDTDDQGASRAESDDWQDADEHGAEAREPLDREEVGAEEDGGDRPPRRRRARRGRDRSSDSAPKAGAERSVARNGRQPTPAAIDDDDDEDADDLAALSQESDDDDEGEGGSQRASHKSIPSWAEAIGVMVETNMASRKNLPQRPSSPRGGGGRGRGRGRGGRGGGGGRRSS